MIDVAVRMTSRQIVGGHRGGIQACAFSPDGSRFVAGDNRGELVMRELRGGECVETARVRVPPAGPHSAPEVRAVVWPTADLVVTQEYGAIRVRRAADLVEVSAVHDVGTGLAVVGGGELVAALGERSVDLHDVPRLSYRVQCSPSRGDYEYFRTTKIAADATGSLVFVADDGGSDETAMGATTRSGEAKISVFDASTREPKVGNGWCAAVHEIPGHADSIHFDSWRKWLLASTYRGELIVWQPDGRELRRVRLYGDTPIKSLTITERSVITSADTMIPRPSTLDVWDPSTFEHQASVPMPGDLAPSWLAASLDGRLLITREMPTAQSVFGLRIWNVETVTN